MWKTGQTFRHVTIARRSNCYHNAVSSAVSALDGIVKHAASLAFKGYSLFFQWLRPD